MEFNCFRIINYLKGCDSISCYHQLPTKEEWELLTIEGKDLDTWSLTQEEDQAEVKLNTAIKLGSSVRHVGPEENLIVFFYKIVPEVSNPSKFLFVKHKYRPPFLRSSYRYPSSYARPSFTLLRSPAVVS